MKRNLLKITAAFLTAGLALGLAGCRNGQIDVSGLKGPGNTVIVDQLYKTDEDDQTIFLFRYGDNYYDTEHIYNVDVTGFDIECDDGGFLRVDCDVTYLSGGEAGFNQFPVIRNVDEVYKIDIKGTIPPGGSLPYVESKRFGLSVIGDYADADYCLWSWGMSGVLKDGRWLYKYDDHFYTDDGATVCCKKGADHDELLKKIKDGVILSEDLFVMPPMALSD